MESKNPPRRLPSTALGFDTNDKAPGDICAPKGCSIAAERNSHPAHHHHISRPSYTPRSDHPSLCPVYFSDSVRDAVYSKTKPSIAIEASGYGHASESLAATAQPVHLTGEDRNSLFNGRRHYANKGPRACGILDSETCFGDNDVDCIHILTR